MTILLYNKELGLAIGDDLDFPEEVVLEEAGHPENRCNIDEWETYFIKSYKGSLPQLPSNSLPFKAFRLPEGIKAFNFKNQVGLTRIGDLFIEIKNKKIGETAYHALLDHIADRYAELVFSFSKSQVGHSWSKSGQAGENADYVDYLLLKRYLLTAREGLQAIEGAIRASPHQKLRREVVSTGIESIRFVDPALLMMALSSPDNLAVLHSGHPLEVTPLGQTLHRLTKKRFFPLYMGEGRRELTLDTPENRFVKHFLEELGNRLEKIRDRLSSGRTHLNPDINAHLKKLGHQIDHFQKDPMWRDVKPMTNLPENSQVLQKREGYRQLFRLHSLMQLVTRYEFATHAMDFKHLLETKDVPTLFEYWCFFLIKEILDSRSTPIAFEREMIHAHETQLNTLSQGRLIEYEGDIHLYFQWPTGKESYSLGYEPDIVVTKGSRKLIFDAKNKGQKGGNSLSGEEEDGRIGKWKDEDIGKMHTYREAIHDVWGAFALYPGREEGIFPQHPENSHYSGVGALPLRPLPGGGPEPDHLHRLGVIIGSFLEAES